MAIAPQDIISAGKIDTSDNAYPYGKAQNRSAPGAGDGTNFEADWLNDQWGFQQALLSEVGATPSGNPDKVGTSQYLDATKTIADRSNDGFGVLNWNKTAAALGYVTAYGGCWARSARLWIVVGGPDECSASFDDGRTWSDFSAGMASTVNLHSVSASATGYGFAVGASATYYKTTDLGFGGGGLSNWTNLTMPGSPTVLNTIKAWDNQDTHIVVGEQSGDPFVANSATLEGTFTERSAPASFTGHALGSLAMNDNTVAVFAANDDHTKLARSTDGGDTWADCTTTLNAGTYQLTYNKSRGKFYAVRTNDSSPHYVYESSDGNTWTQVFSGSLNFDNSIGGTVSHGLESYGAALVIAGTFDILSGVAVSTDAGRTWTRHLFDESDNNFFLVGDRFGTAMLACIGGDQMYYALRRAAFPLSAL